MRIGWTEPAARALESIQEYIARDKRHADWDVAQRIRHAVGQLEDHPQLGWAGAHAGSSGAGYTGTTRCCAVPYKRQRGPDSEPVPHGHFQVTGAQTVRSFRSIDGLTDNAHRQTVRLRRRARAETGRRLFELSEPVRLEFVITPRLGAGRVHGNASARVGIRASRTLRREIQALGAQAPRFGSYE